MSDIERAARKIGATPADIPGLWNAPGYPELTTNQLLNVAVVGLLRKAKP